MSCAAAQRTRVLIVEDNPADVLLLRCAITEVGDWPVETTVALDGEQAIVLLRKQAVGGQSSLPDLVILDLNLPRIHGAEVLRIIRTSEALLKLVVVILSSFPHDVILEKVRTLGVEANCYCTKPEDFDRFLVLIRTIHQCYESARAR
jgi:two-component system, chemotaxis family, response regulator Rcp1